MARRAQAGRFRIGFTGGLAIVMLLAHAGQWHLRAEQGNSRMQVRWTPDGQPKAVVEVDQQGVPRALLPYVSPEVDGRRYGRWILTSALVHSNVTHLAVNVGLLLLLGHALRRRPGRSWMAAALLAGQASGTLVGWWTFDAPPGTQSVALIGASCAVSGLFGAYLVTHLLARRKWVQASLFLAIFIFGIRLSTGRVNPARQFSLASHVAGLAAGAAVAGLWALRRRTGDGEGGRELDPAIRIMAGPPAALCGRSPRLGRKGSAFRPNLPFPRRKVAGDEAIMRIAARSKSPVGKRRKSSTGSPNVFAILRETVGRPKKSSSGSSADSRCP